MVKKITAFYISGIAMMLAVGLIKYWTDSDFGFFSTLLYFTFGGAIGVLATTSHTSFIKNIAFGSVFLVLLWLIFLPITNFDSNSWIVKQNELITIVILGLIFLEREFWNALAKARGGKTHGALTFIGTILLLILFQVTDIGDAIWAWWSKHLWFTILFLAIWWPFLLYLLFKAIMHDVSGLRQWYKRIIR